ncbi:gamma-glutamyl-gamma-aminobutyrate hydrolase family protein [Microvirga sp. 2YAF29]|uniref:gamma-glutamyl-gamma-aminobutyrate hydrolase family protein n=1 Tax=Microvirga sp. 2YAF29 TaxID=3233031 RepID=UPI003F94AF62
MPMRPRIAVIMDENTSVDGTRYDMTKHYFAAIHKAGGLPFGIPYFMDMVESVVSEFDGFLSTGGRFAFPDEWFIAGQTSHAPESERLDVEIAIMRGFLERGKPILGICNGMQILAGINGCRLSPNIRALGSHVMEHDKRGHMHPVSVKPNTALACILGVHEITVNTFHREGVVEPSDRVVVGATAPDGIIEAIELPSQPFAIGVQWHQELFTGNDHPGNKLFDAFVQAAGMSR